MDYRTNPDVPSAAPSRAEEKDKIETQHHCQQQCTRAPWMADLEQEQEKLKGINASRTLLLKSKSRR